MLVNNYPKQSPIIGVAGLGGGINSYIFLSGGADPYIISRSLRFNSGDSAYLNRTPSSATNQRTWTYSGWVKRSSLSGNLSFFSAGSDASNRSHFLFDSVNQSLRFFDVPTSLNIVTTQVLRDASAWYHFVLAVDTTQATSTDRVKIYINGVQVTSFSTATYPSQNADLQVNKNIDTRIGSGAAAYPEYFNGYLADIHLVDGQALSPTSFGETDTSGVWQPKKFSGAHGTNGFHLDFKDNSSNAALGYDAAGSNNFTVNNLTAVSVSTYGINFDGNDKVVFPGTTFTGDLTIECFVKASSYSGIQRIFSANEGTNGGEYTDLRAYNGAHEFYFGTGSNVSDSGTTMPVNVWNHIAITRSGSTVSYYMNGTRLGTDTYSGSVLCTSMVLAHGYGSEYLTGQISNARIVNGQALYTGSSYTVPTGPLTTTSQGATASNVTHLLANTSSVTANGGTGSAGTAGGDPTVVSASTFGSASAVDSLVDTPTNGTQTDTGVGGQITGNYATYNPVRVGSGTKSNGNLTVTGTGQVPDVTSIAPNSGKWYAEIKWDSGTYARIGLQDVNIATSDFGGVNGQSYRYESNSGNVQPGGQTYSTYAAGDIIGVAFDCDAGKLWLAKNGTWQNSGDPAAGSGAVATNLVSGSHYAPANSSGSGSSVFTLNAGQRAFTYTAPTGFKSLCTANLPEPTIVDGSKYFDTKLWSGNNSTQAIQNLGFSPDLIWAKARNSTNWHELYDTVRGNTVRLFSNTTDGDNATSGLDSFDTNGFTLNNASGINNTSSTNVGWAWDAGTIGANEVGSYWSPAYNTKYIGFKFPTSSGGRAVFGLESGTGTADIYTSTDNSSWTRVQQNVTLSTTDSTYTSSAQYLIIVNTSDATWGAHHYAMATNGTDAHYSSATYPGSGASFTWSGPGYTDWDFRSSGTVIKPGGLNSSVYDQSQTWSNGKDGDRSDYPVTNVFDASLTTIGYGGVNQTITVTLPGGSIALTSLRVRAERVGTATGKFYVNGNDYTSQIASGTNWNTITGETSITSIGYASDTGSNFVGLYAVEVNGMQLVDSGVTVPNVPSISSTVRANPTAGFSIVSYTGTGANATVSHGLNTAAELIIVKNRSTGDSSWPVYHISTGNGNRLYLNGTNASSSGTNWNSTTPTSSVFSIGTNPDTNGSTNNLIAYCFSPISGYSAMGSYTGNGSADGPFVFTEFNPAFLLARRSDDTQNWIIVDGERSPSNVVNKGIYADLSNAEQTSNRCDFLSNGFKIRINSGELNTNNGTYIYLAFASNPFKTARAR